MLTLDIVSHILTTEIVSETILMSISFCCCIFIDYRSVARILNYHKTPRH